MIFPQNKKILNILRSYCFVVEVTFKTRFWLLNIFMTLLFPDFFLIIGTTKHSTLKHWNQFGGKRHHSCEIKCLVLTASELCIAGIITACPIFTLTVSRLIGKMGTLIFNKCACP